MDIADICTANEHWFTLVLLGSNLFLFVIGNVEDPLKQGCQMVCFQTKNPNFGEIWRALEWKMSLYFMTFLNILWPLGKI
jgi:hypothetical protein